MSKRPAGVPAKAKWEGDQSQTWHLGKTSHQGVIHYGEQRWWRADGSLYGFAGYDKQGNRHGLTEYFHPDGTLAQRETWHKGEQLTNTFQSSTTCPGKPPICACWLLDKKDAKKIFRHEQNVVSGKWKHFRVDGTPCDASGKPLGKAVAPRAPKYKPTKNTLVKKWRALEALLYAKGLSWALHYAPAKLTFERAPAWTKQVTTHLPEDYAAFVKEVGYPMLGFGLYDNTAWSFLPPAPLRFHTTLCFSPEGDDPEGEGKSFAAFFAAYRDLADITGYACIDGIVWRVRDALPREKLGTFTAWMTGELARITKYVTKLSAKHIEQLTTDCSDEPDPHRLIDYSES